MYKVESNKAIGEYVSKLIARKYGPARQFAIAYLMLRDGLNDEPPADQIQLAANKFSQLKTKGKGVTITDLPILSELLDVSVDNILSAGKVSKTVPTRMTNYSVAFSGDKKTWKEYVERPDNLILNPDEYGKTVIDYALEFGNYKLIKYLIANKYISFVGDKKNEYWGTFGADSIIKRRLPQDMDLLVYKIRERDDLRTNVIALAIENEDYSILDSMKAREIPALYEGNYFYGKDLDFKKYYNPKLLEAIAKGTEKVQVYFSEEFEIETNRNAVCHYMFPYLGKLIEMVIKSDGKAAPTMLKNALHHNNSVLKGIEEVATTCAESVREYCAYMDKDEFCKTVMNDYQFHIENDTVGYHNRMIKQDGFRGIFSNVIQVKAISKDQYVMSLIEDVNRSYERIKKYTYKED